MDYSVMREFRHALSTAPHLVDLKNICRDFCTEIALDYYLFSVCEVVSLIAPKIITLTNFPPWVGGSVFPEPVLIDRSHIEVQFFPLGAGLVE